MATTAITHFNRIEPRPRFNDLRGSLAAEIRDPLWFLMRQWQLGELQGEDAGTVAYVRYNVKSTQIRKWQHDGDVHSVEGTAPLEPQTLAEPFRADLSIAVELGQEFVDQLSIVVKNDAIVGELVSKLATAGYRIQAPVAGAFSPIDSATQRFLLVCADHSLDGYALYTLANQILAGTNSVPASVTSDTTELDQIQAALDSLVEYVGAVYGKLSDSAQPEVWEPERLEYKLAVTATNPSGNGNATLDVHPDRDGEFEWFSFDVVSRDTSVNESTPDEKSYTTLPTRIRFPGMPNPRFWTFEEGSLSFVDISADRGDMIKMLVTDFMLIHGDDWYSLPYEMPVGTLAKIEGVVVYDVFGTKTYIARADQDVTTPGLNRWTMFSIADSSGTVEGLSDYFILPQSSGEATQHGVVLEDVRFVRDEMANMAWAIERSTTSSIGETLRGAERDAAVDALSASSPDSSTTDLPLRYQIETRVPINWIPLLAVQPDTNNPSMVLQRSAMVRPVASIVGGSTTYVNEAVPALGTILNPIAATTVYQIAEEEIPRSGTVVQRVVHRSRWIDGSTHFWVQRRRRTGSGESQSNLNFDQALSND